MFDYIRKHVEKIEFSLISEKKTGTLQEDLNTFNDNISYN